MNLLVWDDGRVVRASEYRCPRSYVLQRIHTLGYQATNLGRHIMLLRESSAELFGFMSLCQVGDADRIISRLLQESRVSPRFSCSVAMRLDSRGALSFEVETPSYYEGASLRAKRLRGAFIHASEPREVCQNSVTVAIDAMNDSRIKGYGDMPLWVDDSSNLISRPWRPIFAVYGKRVYTPQQFDSVEYVVAREAILAAGFELVIHSLPVKSLKRMEELFEVDIMGITSLYAIEEHRLLFMTTAQIANKMQPKLK